MVDIGFIVIIVFFIVYYIAVLIVERRIIQDPKNIIDKFLSTVLLYAGVSLIYFSITGKPFVGDDIETYNIYIFVMGFISVLWTVPNMMNEFTFFRNFFRGRVGKTLHQKNILKTENKRGLIK